MNDAQSKGFDKLAGVYDMLTIFVFGKSMRNAQRHHLLHIKEHVTILILGGGTGWLLDDILRNKANCEVWFLDISKEMIALAKKRNTGNNRIHFIQATEEAIPREIMFDVIITNFYLDLFSGSLPAVLKRILHQFSESGKWIVVDFVNEDRWWQQAMLRAMYLFFRMMCSIEAKALPSWREHMMRLGLILKDHQKFFCGFIHANVYQKL